MNIQTPVTPQERLQKRVNSIWVRQQPIAVPSFEDRWLQNRENLVRQNRYNAQLKQTKSFLFDYNDPHQINSFADVIYKNAPKGFAGIGDAVVDTLTLFNEAMIQPTLHGDPGAAALNTLMGFSETMDIVANPVKGYLMDGPEGFNNAVRRKNYDWDTGNVFNNIVLEIASDPLNWLTLGGWALAKTAVSVGADAMKAAIKTSLPSISEQATKTLTKRLLMDPKYNAPGEVIRMMGRFQSGRYVNELGKQGLADFAATVSKHRTTMGVIKAADTLRKIGNTADGIVLQGTLNTSLGFAPLMLRGRTDKAFGYMYNAVSKNLGRYKDQRVIPLKSFMGELSTMLIQDAALKVANDMADGLPSSWVKRTVNAFSQTHVKELDGVLKDIIKDKQLLPEQVVVRYDAFAKAQGLEDFSQYIAEVETLMAKPNVAGYFIGLKSQVDRAKAVYESRLSQGRYTVLKQLKDRMDIMYLRTDAARERIKPLLLDIEDLHQMIQETYEAGESLSSLQLKALQDIIEDIDNLYKARILDETEGVGDIITELYIALGSGQASLKEINALIHALTEPLRMETLAVYGDVLKALSEQGAEGLQPIQKQFNSLMDLEGHEILKYLEELDAFTQQVDKLIDSFKPVIYEDRTMEQLLKSFSNETAKTAEAILSGSHVDANGKSIKVTQEINTRAFVDGDLDPLANMLEDLRHSIEPIHDSETMQALVDEAIEYLDEAVAAIKAMDGNGPEILDILKYNILPKVRLIHPVDDIMDLISDMEVRRTGNVAVDPDKLYYHMMVSKITAELSLMSIPNLNKIIDDFKSLEGFGALLMYLSDLKVTGIDGFNELIGRMVHKFSGLSNKRDLYSGILNSPVLDKEVQVALLDTIQNLARKDIQQVAKGMDYHIKDIQAKVENNIMFLKEKDSLRLGGSHNAEDDVTKTYELAQEIAAEELAQYKHHITYDIETTGLKANGARVLQIAYSINGGKPISIWIKPDPLHMPDRSGLLTLLTPYHSNEVLAAKELPELQELFMKQFDRADAVTEEQALHQFADVLDNLSRTPGKVLAVTQNGIGFDNKFLALRAQHHPKLNLILNLPMLDTFAVAKAARNHRSLTHDETQEIDQLLRNYLTLTSMQTDDRVIKEMIRDPNYNALYSRPDLNDSVTYEALPSVDQRLLTDTTQLLDFFRPVMKDDPEELKAVKLQLQKHINSAEIYQVLEGALGTVKDELGAALSGMKATNRGLQTLLIDADAVKEAFGISGSIMELFGRDLKDADGKLHAFSTQIIKKAHDPKRTWQFFKRTTDAQEFLRYNDAAQSMDNLRKLIDLPENIPDNLNALVPFLSAWAGKLDTVSGARLKHLIDNMEFNTDRKTLFAQLAYINMRLGTSLDDAQFKEYTDGFIETYGKEMLALLKSPGDLRYDWLKKPYAKDPEKFYSFNAILGAKGPDNSSILQRVIEDIDDLDETYAKELDAFSALVDVQTKAGAGTPLAYQEMAVISDMALLFKDTRELLHRLMEQTDESSRPQVEEYFRDLFIEQDTYRNLNLLLRKLQLSPQDMAAELYHLSRGRMAFNGNDILKYGEDIPGTKQVQQLFETMLKNREAYEAHGIRFTSEGDWALVHLSADPQYLEGYSQLKLPRIDEDVVTLPMKRYDELLNRPAFKGLEDEIHRLMLRMGDQRRDLLRRHPEARASTLELLSVNEFYRIDQLFPQADDILPLTHYTESHMLDGLNFNHSILGTARARRRVLAHGSTNPLKTLAMTQQQISMKVGAQTQWTSIMLDPMHALTGPYYGKLTDDELFGMLQGHREFRAAFLANDKKRGYAVRHVIINGPKDVAFARSVGAVVLPVDVYNRTRSIVNDFKVTNGLMNLVNRMWLQPLKLGMLLSEGFLVRNIVDSNLKNVLAHGPGILRHTLGTIKNYAKFVVVVKKVLLLGAWSRDNINKVFDEMPQAERFDSNGADFRDLFDIYNRFLNDGATGMVTELEEYFQDTAKAMLRRSRLRDSDHNPLLTEQEIIDYFKTPAEVRPHYFSKVLDPAKYAELVRLAEDYSYYRRAYQMHKNTRNLRLQLENIVDYMKRPETLPEDLVEEYSQLYQKYGTEETHDSEVVESIRGGFNWFMAKNGDVERIVRLASYTHALEEGLSEHEAMHQVIKLHFDYANKNELQLYGEMVFPFSTFALNNFLFWAEQMLNNPIQARLFSDIMTPVWNFDEYSTWDMQNRKTLQFQMLAGNPILDDKGTTLKLNPSIMDMVKILTQPGEFPEDRLNSALRTPMLLAQIKQKEWETDEEFDDRRRRMWLSLIPVVGTIWNRYTSNSKADTAWGQISPSLFGKTSIPQPRPERPKFRPRQFPTYPKTGYKKKNFGFYKKSYKQLRAESIPFEYSAVKDRGFQRPYLTRGYWKYQHHRKSLYADMASKSGKLKRLLMFLPTDKYNLKFKLRWMDRY